MTIHEKPYFMENEEWYYFDDDEWKYKLTDKAPEEAKQSYNEHYELLESQIKLPEKLPRIF